MKTKIQIRRDTAANWASNNPILSAGEFGLESDTQKIKVGNGSTNWASRPYINVLPSDLAELSQDAVNTALTAGNGITKEYDDLNNTITISVDTSIIANKDYVDNAISEVLDGAPGLLDTLKELAAAIDDDPAFFTSVATNLSNHEADTTNIHGIADSAELATKAFAAALLTGATKSNITITGDKNGLTITAENGVADSTTSDLVEGTNLYFTDERAQDAANTAIVAGEGLDKTYDDESNTITLDIDSTVVTLTDTQSLSNKTLTSPVINGATVGGDIIPSSDATYDLGSPENKFKDLYLSGATLYLDTATIELNSTDIKLSHSGNSTTIPIGNGNHTVATLAGEQTLSNKTLTRPTINGPEITEIGGTPRIHGIYLPSPHSITFEGATNDEFETVLTTVNPTADHTIALPDASGTIALTSDIAELSQDAIDNAIVAGVGLDKVYDDEANTITLDIDSTVTTNSGTQTLTNKTISFAKGVISSAVGYDNIEGFFGQNNIVVLQDALDKGGKLNISNEGVITVPFPGNGYTTGVATIGGGTRVIITASGNNITGTINQFNDSLTDANFATIDGVESLTNKTLTSPKINEDVVLSATSSELNILDGATLSTTELNYVDGVTSSVQDQIDDKAPIDSPVFTGNVQLPATTVFGSNTASSAGKYLRTDGTNVSWAYPVIPYGSNGSPNPVNGQLFFNMDTLSLQIFMDGQWIKLTSYFIDGGDPLTTSFANTFDGGSPSEEPTSTLDGGNVNSFPDANEGAGLDGGEI
jgi:hypothetical protein